MSARENINVFFQRQKQLKAYLLDYVYNNFISFICLNFVLTFLYFIELEVTAVSTVMSILDSISQANLEWLLHSSIIISGERMELLLPQKVQLLCT